MNTQNEKFIKTQDAPEMKVTVPVALSVLSDRENAAEQILHVLRQQFADEVFLFTEMQDFSHNSETVEKLRRFVPYFEKNGIRCAVWFTTLHIPQGHNFQKIVDINGKVRSMYCPLDDAYTEAYTKGVYELAQSGIGKIVFDDDFRMHMPDDEMQCFCPHHLKLYGEYLGHPVTREEMAEHLQNDGPGRYRDAWMYGCREGLRRFAELLRKTVDTVDPEIELMLCSGPSHFGADGSNAEEYARILARDKEKIELRTIGAPYWQKGLYIVENMMSAVDFARHQAHVLREHGIDPVAEGDPCPRPRHSVPASHLEFFHTVMLADGAHTRIMKYLTDYTSSPCYETGYADLSHPELYAEIERMFSGKKETGVFLCEPFDRVCHEENTDSHPESVICRSAARQFLNDNALPAVFSPGGVNLIFGENASAVDLSLLKNGSILDIRAAEILFRRGVDVGIEVWSREEEKQIPSSEHGTESPIETCKEYFCRENEITALFWEPHMYNPKLSGKAVIESVYRRRSDEIPASYFYENDNGERFLVFNFVGNSDCTIPGLFKNYARQRQLIFACEQYFEKPLDAVCPGHPGLYMMVKKNETSMTVGLWNFFDDPIVKPVVTLSRNCSDPHFLNGKGYMEGNRIVFTSDIPAYTYAIVQVSNK